MIGRAAYDVEIGRSISYRWSKIIIEVSMPMSRPVPPRGKPFSRLILVEYMGFAKQHYPSSYRGAQAWNFANPTNPERGETRLRQIPWARSKDRTKRGGGYIKITPAPSAQVRDSGPGAGRTLIIPRVWTPVQAGFSMRPDLDSTLPLLRIGASLRASSVRLAAVFSSCARLQLFCSSVLAASARYTVHSIT